MPRIALGLVLLFILLMLQYKLWISPGSVREIYQLEDEIRTQTQENTYLLARNRGLDAEVADLKKGLEAIEARARLELGLIREGETFYQIIPSSQ